MKYIKFLLIAAGLMAAASCARDEVSNNESQDKNMVDLSFEASFDVHTKAEVGEKGENGYTVLWSPGDAITVFPVNDASGNVGYRFTSANEEAVAYTTFTGQAPADESYYAIYPYSSQHQWDAAQGKIRLRSSNIRYAEGLGGRSYMMAEENDGHLYFKHIYGYIKFTVPESVTDLTEMEFVTSGTHVDARYVDFYPETMTIGELEIPTSSLILIPDVDETYIKPGTYYMALLPGMLPDGFSMRFYNEDGLRFIKETSKSVEIVQGQILNLGEISDLCFDYPISTCEEVYNAGVEGNDGKYYRVRGRVTAIANTNYGNWYITDETGYQIYIYGTIDENGIYYGSERFDLALGDYVTVQGPIKNYNGVIEFVDANIVELKKNPVRLDQDVRDGVVLPVAGGEVAVGLTVKGDVLDVYIPEDAQSWLSVTSIEWQSDTTAAVTLSALENTGAGRSAVVEFNTVKDGDRYFTFLYVQQESAVLDATAVEINAADDGPQVYRLTGYVSSVVNSKYGNLYIKDYSGDVYIYGTYDADGNRFDTFADPVREGDIITIEGTKSSYKESPQMMNVKLVQHYPVQDVTVQDFLAAPADDGVYYRLTGTMKDIAMTSEGQQNPNGNFNLVDDTAAVYVYQLLTGWGGPKREFHTLGLQEGCLLTLVGQRSEYRDTPRAVNSFYVRHDLLSR